jgi:AraC-like DNA-binding protein
MSAQRVTSPGAHTRRQDFQEQFGAFTRRLQMLAGELAQDARPLDDVARSIDASLPAVRSAAEFLLVQAAVTDFSARVLETAALHRLASIVRLLALPVPDQADGGDGGRHGRAIPAGVSGLPAPLPCGVPESIQSLRSLRAMAVIRSRCCEPTVTAESVARDVGVSRQYLARLLRLHHGCGFRAALQRARLERAQSLLERSLVSIKEVAADSGFSSTSQFDRAFKRQYAVTPGEYRRLRFGPESSSRVESTST